MESSADSYDFIFLGAGCASLSIIMRLIDSGKFVDKKILLIDKDEKTRNDRTWCFWESGKGYFENIVYKTWKGLRFLSDNVDLSLDIKPYEYKMIRGIDFYNHCLESINSQDNITRKYGQISFEGDPATISVNGKLLNVGNAIVFNSIYIPALEQNKTISLKQHFKGWIIEMDKIVFDPAKATLMDFRVDQSLGTTFVYVLPLSEKKALVEYTLFNESILLSSQYDVFLSSYLEKYFPSVEYKVLEDEMGVIPMTSESFSPFKKGIYQVGTAGGQTKASTGYTFCFIQKQAQAIVEDLIAKRSINKHTTTSKRFSFYDNTLLHILSGNRLPGKKIFEQLFTRNKASSVFKFLDNETNIGEELRIINSLPKKVFMQAGFSEFLKMIS